MRVFLTILLAGLVVVLGVAADDHMNTTEKKGSDEITISRTVKIADTVLPAGRYRVACDRETISFEPATGKGEKVTFPCRGKELQSKAGATELYLNLAGGQAVVTKLLLRGSNIEHTF